MPDHARKKKGFFSNAFSPWRMELITASLLYCLLPMHFVFQIEPTETNGLLVTGSILLLVVLTSAFCLFDDSPNRFIVLGLAIAAVVLHGLCM